MFGLSYDRDHACYCSIVSRKWVNRAFSSMAQMCDHLLQDVATPHGSVSRSELEAHGTQHRL